MPGLDILIYIIIGIIAIGALIFYVIKTSHSSSKIESAVNYIKNKEYDKAIPVFKNMISKNDQNSDAHYYLGECYFQIENYEWALPEFKRVLRKNKYTEEYSESMVRRRIANIFLHFNQTEEAQKEFLLVIQLEPNEFKNFFEIGKIFYERDHLDKAAQYIKKAIELNNNHPDSFFYSGMIKYRMKLYSEALFEFEQCVNLDKYYYKANYYIGMVNYNVKNYPKALEQLDFAIRDKEFRSKSLLQRGIIYFDTGEIDNAAVELEKAVGFITEEDNVARTIRYHLANCYENKKDIAAAIEQWEKISASEPDFRDVEEKLENYAELRMEDNLKDLFVASNEAFERYCREVLKNMGLQVQDLTSLGSMLAEFIVSESLGTKDVRVQKLLVRIYRHNEPLGDKVIREMVERIKQESMVIRGICLSATGFSKQATDYGETRPIDLISGKELSSYLRGESK